MMPRSYAARIAAHRAPMAPLNASFAARILRCTSAIWIPFARTAFRGSATRPSSVARVERPFIRKRLLARSRSIFVRFAARIISSRVVPGAMSRRWSAIAARDCGWRADRLVNLSRGRAPSAPGATAPVISRRSDRHRSRDRHPTAAGAIAHVPFAGS